MMNCYGVTISIKHTDVSVISTQPEQQCEHGISTIWLLESISITGYYAITNSIWYELSPLLSFNQLITSVSISSAFLLSKLETIPSSPVYDKYSQRWLASYPYFLYSRVFLIYWPCLCHISSVFIPHLSLSSLSPRISLLDDHPHCYLNMLESPNFQKHYLDLTLLLLASHFFCFPLQWNFK